MIGRYALPEIQWVAVAYFQHAYQCRDNVHIEFQLWVAELYPNMFAKNNNCELYKDVDLEEVHSILKTFSRGNVLDETDGLLNFSSIFLITCDQISFIWWNSPDSKDASWVRSTRHTFPSSQRSRNYCIFMIIGPSLFVISFIN